MAVWKIASRWSDDGNSNSVLPLFRKYQMVFVYNCKPNSGESYHIEKKVHINDLVAISDGHKIVSIGKVIAEPHSIVESWDFEHDMDAFRGQNVIAIKVKLVDLKESDRFDYGRRGRFHALYNGDEKNVVNIWIQYFISKEEKREFSIDAKTCSLKYNISNPNNVLLNDKTKYVIPIYQRPYSWSEEQVRKFISDIFLTYEGSDEKLIAEPMFIGTMQLSEKHYNNLYEEEQEVIDGQQRLITFMILFKVLKIRYPLSNELTNIKLNWLESNVDNGEQQNFINELLDYYGDFTDKTETLNPYIINASIINEIILEQTKDEQDQDNKIEFDIDDFIKYVLSKIYFVVIETFAGLSKTLQIFNAINTTGLDLNGGDIFKIRMYEYLHDIKKSGDNAFNEISELYKTIEQENNKRQKKVTDIRGILNIYQYILIAKYNLSTQLYQYSSDTFFERLFDTIFNINRWDNFNNVSDLNLDLKEIKKLIELRYQWEDINYPTAEDACSVKLLLWSRYSRYRVLIFVFLYRFASEEDYIKKLFLFIRQLSKLYTIYSILYLKSINKIHNFTYNLIKLILEKPFTDLIDTINNEIKSKQDEFEKHLKGNIVYNSKIKNILCRISAMLDEDYISTNQDIVQNIEEKLFQSPIDIEHIQAYNDSDKEKRSEILNEWGESINSIGNLMVLEQDINRSIGNKKYELKKTKYPKSKFQIVRNLINNYTDWSLGSCNERAEKEIIKLNSYLFTINSWHPRTEKENTLTLN